MASLKKALELVNSCKENKEGQYTEEMLAKIKEALAIIQENYVHENTPLLRHHLNSAKMALDYFAERCQARSKGEAIFQLEKAIKLQGELETK